MMAKKIEREEIESSIEHKMTMIKMIHNLKKARPGLILENDDFFHESFTPFQKLVETHLAHDPSMPEEIRKMINVIKPEEQNLMFPVFDASSSRLKT